MLTLCEIVGMWETQKGATAIYTQNLHGKVNNLYTLKF